MGVYQDIIKLSPPVTLTEMTMLERAAQFSSFAALSGFEDAIDSVEQDLNKALAQAEQPCDWEFWD